MMLLVTSVSRADVGSRVSVGKLVGIAVGSAVAVGSEVGVSGAAQLAKRASKRHPINNRLLDNIVFTFPSYFNTKTRQDKFSSLSENHVIQALNAPLACDVSISA
jgi:hypothetical protein